MPAFEYEALDVLGHTVRGIVDADNSSSAVIKLRQQGIYITEIREETEGRAAGLRAHLRMGPRVHLRETALAIRQLSTLVGAGVPLADSLSALIDQTDNLEFKKILIRVRQRVREGSALADALGEHPRVFSALVVSMIRIGESSGALAEVCLRTADHLEHQVEFRNSLASILAYPSLVLAVSIGVLGFLLAYVVPRVIRIFFESGQALPLPTRILVGLSGFVHDAWWVIAAVAVLALFAWRSYARTERGRVALDRMRINLPVIGSLTLRRAVFRFVRTLGIMLASGVPILDALEVGKDVVGNRVLLDAVEQVRQGVSEGKDLAGPLARSRLFPPMVTQMVVAGERSGELDNMLLRVSEAGERELEHEIRRLVSLIEPIAILVMGLVVGFIVLAILLPIFEMNQLIR